jgi:methionine--tRNA ligase beta chain
MLKPNKFKEAFMPDVMVSIEEFKSIDIRIGMIIEVKDHELAKKPMYILRVDFGAEIGERQIVAGIKDRYTKEELTGKKMAFIVNLEPKSVAGIISNGMIMAGESGELLSVLVPDRDVPPGTKVY